MAKMFSPLHIMGFLLSSTLLITNLDAQWWKEGVQNESANYSSPQTNVNASCGADCNCGCKTGGVCSCNNAMTTSASEFDSCCGDLDDKPIGRIFDQQPVYENSCPCATGIWLPEDPVLFRPLMADPRQITYSAGWRFNDQALEKNVIDVSFGDSVPFYRWLHVGPWDGQLQIDLEGALWAVFDPLHDSSPLINADYYGGIPITYAAGDWSFRLRAYHISCHIGDEYLLNHPTFERRNPSAEFVDFYASWDYTDELRFYAGLGVVVAQDKSWCCGRVYYEAGVEVRMPRLGFIDRCSQLYGMPIFAMDFEHQTQQDKHINQTYVLGYEWGKLSGLQRKLRLYLEYHDGYSYEGQFCKTPTDYLSLRVSYGY